MSLSENIIKTISEKLIDSKVKDAEETLESFGISYRYTIIDGEKMMVTMDYDPSRINLSVNKGTIVGAKVG